MNKITRLIWNLLSFGELVEIAISQYHFVQKAFDQFLKHKRNFNYLKISKVHFTLLLYNQMKEGFWLFPFIHSRKTFSSQIHSCKIKSSSSSINSQTLLIQVEDNVFSFFFFWGRELWGFKVNIFICQGLCIWCL